jgi:hypothetical protein
MLALILEYIYIINTESFKKYLKLLKSFVTKDDTSSVYTEYTYLHTVNYFIFLLVFKLTLRQATCFQ